MLHQWGFAHEAVSPGFEDGVLIPGLVTPAQWVASLAYLKAWAGATHIRATRPLRRTLVLGADTTCVLDDVMVGTPTTPDQARAMLRSFVAAAQSPKVHHVLTGVAIVDANETDGVMRHVLVDVATVRVGSVSDDAIDDYVASGQWEGKAGGYNLAERLDAGWPITFEGDQTTIMGLPMNRLAPILRKYGVEAAPVAGQYFSP